MASNNAKRTNILFILSDDHGAWAMGNAGNPEVITPNLDRLAEEGVRFSDFFCASPVCSPARASLVTGRIPSQHGIHDWLREGNTGADAVEFLEEQLSYTEVLAQAGYSCGLSGKWHLGRSLKPQKGFTDWYAHQGGGGPYLKPPMVRDGAAIQDEGYVTGLITDKALQLINKYTEDKPDQPFYISVHYTAPHTPWDQDQHPPEIWQLYENCPFTATPEEEPHPWQINSCPHGQGETRKKLLRGYYTAITAMDYNIGRIIDRLDELGLRENTLIIYTSDNGMNLGHHGLWGKGNASFPQNMYDTSVKVPFIASQPGRIPQAAVCGELVSAYDFMPTLLDYAGVDYEHAAALPGRSFAPLLYGAAAEADQYVVVHDEYGPVRMIRTREWKYVHRYPYGPHELYDLAADPDESRNLLADDAGGTNSEAAAVRLERTKQLKAMLEHWFHQYADPAIDGVREPVSGSGQLYWAGVRAHGVQAFAGLNPAHSAPKP
ncbi:MAG: sulfatase [Paenibacillaceae bacterium]|jgi:arylsulfatase A-like enzyme|nr:sulfatase [Paenibacillaceae bacterium]